MFRHLLPMFCQNLPAFSTSFYAFLLTDASTLHRRNSMRTDNRRKRTFIQSSGQSHLESFGELFKQISPSNYWSCLVFTRLWCNIFESETLCQCPIALLRQTLEFGSTILSRSVMLNECRKMFKLVQLLMYRPLS